MRCALFAAVVVAVPRHAHAQISAAPAVEVTAGIGSSTGGTYYERAGTSVDIVVSGRPRASRTALIVAVAVGSESPIAGSDVCLLAAGGGCVPDFPATHSIGALAGWETGAPRQASARLMIGPGYFWGGSASAVGVQGRIDLATRALGPLALIGSARGALLPEFHGARICLWAFALELRAR